VNRPPDPQEKNYYKQLAEWKEMREDKNLHILTPEIGESIWWFECGIVRDGLQIAAVCTAIDANQPGVINLTTQAPQTRPSNKSVVRYDPSVPVQDRHGKTIQDYGTWTLKDSQKTVERHRKIWLDFCERKLEQIQRSLKDYQTNKLKLEESRTR
jgi:peptide deformylase